MEKASAARELRTFGTIWIILAPIMWLMAAISTVRSDITYQAQLGVFSILATSSLILGVAAVFHRTWARLGIEVLSWLATIAFLGPGLVLVAAGVLSKSRGNTWELVFVGIGTAAPALLFLAMARRLRTLRLPLADNDA